MTHEHYRNQTTCSSRKSGFCYILNSFRALVLIIFPGIDAPPQINTATSPATAPTNTLSTPTPVALPACAVAVRATLDTLEAILVATDAKDDAADVAADMTDEAADVTEDAALESPEAMLEGLPVIGMWCHESGSGREFHVHDR